MQAAPPVVYRVPRRSSPRKPNFNGCEQKRKVKAPKKTPVRVTKAPKKPEVELVNPDMSYLKKRSKRGRQETEFKVYEKATIATIAKLKKSSEKIKNDEDQLKKIKNQISAYESRLCKRMNAEETVQ